MFAEIDMAHDTSKRSQLNHSSLGVRDADRPTIRKDPASKTATVATKRAAKRVFILRGNINSGDPRQSELVVLFVGIHRFR